MISLVVRPAYLATPFAWLERRFRRATGHRLECRIHLATTTSTIGWFRTAVATSTAVRPSSHEDRLGTHR